MDIYILKNAMKLTGAILLDMQDTALANNAIQWICVFNGAQEDFPFIEKSSW